LTSNDAQSICCTGKLVELAHALAFRDQALGQPLYAPQYAIDTIDARGIHRHLTSNFTAQNITLVGTGIDHATLRNILNMLFSNVAIQGNFYELDALPPLPADQAVSQSVTWSGGEQRNPDAGNTHVLLAYPGASRKTKEEAALAIARAHLNGLAIEGVSVDAHSFNYQDTGLFAYHATGKEGNAAKTVDSANSAVKKLGNISNDEFEQAKQSALTYHVHQVSNSFA